MPGAHAQQVTVQAARLDTSATGMFRKRTEATHFRRGEIIELDLTIDAEIDSASALAGKGFTVVGGPGMGRSHNWSNEEHTFSAWRYYQIKPRRRGRLVVPAVILYSGGKAYSSEPLELMIGR